MKINPVLSVPTSSIRAAKSVNEQHYSKYNQVINLKAGIPIDLGKINDKPFTMQIFQEGGFEWSGSLRIKEPKTGSRVTAEEVAAAYSNQSYTMKEHVKCNVVSTVINYLYSMATDGQEPSTFNNNIKASNISQGEIEEALRCLDIDVKKRFTLNGYAFILDNGILKKYEDEI